ncbi:MAG: peptidylprolyl isomerase [Planctomycetota bacterium]|jgi:parvulin-like peptidyl-prolyl isomerase
MPITVNGEKVAERMITAVMENMRPQFNQYSQQTGQPFDEDKLREFGEKNAIEQVLLRQEADRRNEDIPAEVIEGVLDQHKDKIPEDKHDEVRKDIKTQERIKKIIDDIANSVPEVSPEDVKKYYDENTARFEVPEMVKASHIVKHDVKTPEEKIKSKGELEKIKEQIDSGTPFEDLAAQHSDCGDNGGDLGYFPRGKMVQDFEDVVFNMEVGDVSDIFLTQFGYHIAKVYDKKEAKPTPFEEVSEKLAAHMLDEKRHNKIEAYVNTLREAAEITT